MDIYWRSIKHSERGQALLIMVLLMAVALTIGLAVVSRSITDIRISRQEEQSARVFSAAEAGIEEALRAGAAPLPFPINGINVTVSSSEQGGTPEFAFPEGISQGDTQTIWLRNHTASGELDPGSGYSSDQINVYWGNEGAEPDIATTPALEITVIYNNSGFKVGRYAFDPKMDRRTSTGFEPPTSIGSFPVGGKNFRFMATVSLPRPVTAYYALRLKLIYNTEPQVLGAAAVGAGIVIPNQGKCYESTANDPQTGATNRVQQCRFYKAPPGIFDYVLFSDQNLAK